MLTRSFLFLLGILFTSSLFAQNNESHLQNIKQITFGGDNAEAYWSFDNHKISFQSNNKKWGLSCDQIFMMDMPNNKDILFASTHHANKNCPADPPPSKRYLWAIYPEFDIFISNEKGKIIKQLTNEPGYDAEATVSPKGDKIVFTSTRNGDLDLYLMDIDGKNVKQITFGLGYDGGAFFSPDGTKLVFRASRPTAEAEVADYKDLLSKGLVAPTNMEIYTCNIDGSDLKQVTQLGKANWAPFYHPSSNKIIFSSNHHSEKGYDFQLYLINVDGTGLERVTQTSLFNAFPMFSPDGKKLIFSSNRNNGGTRDTNLFVAEWKD
jgi:Tol biopolymer transport system component